MAAQVQHYACTIPAGTAKASPVTVQMQLGLFVVSWVEIFVPSGPSGLVGFYLASSGQQLIPYNPQAGPNFFIMADAFRHWDLTGQPNSGDWQLIGYNTGINPHTIYITWGLDLVEPAAQPVHLLPSASLSSV